MPQRLSASAQCLPKTYAALEHPGDGALIQQRLKEAAKCLCRGMYDPEDILCLIDLAVMVVRPSLAMLILEYHEDMVPTLDRLQRFSGRPKKLKRFDTNLARDLRRFSRLEADQIVEWLWPRHHNGRHQPKPKVHRPGFKPNCHHSCVGPRTATRRRHQSRLPQFVGAH